MLEVYGIDLAALYRGEVTPRRIATLVAQLPAGCRYRRAHGGFGAWSDEVAATLLAGHRTMTGIQGALGVKQSRLPKPPEPPEEGWLRAREEKTARMERKARRWMARHNRRGGAIA